MRGRGRDRWRELERERGTLGEREYKREREVGGEEGEELYRYRESWRERWESGNKRERERERERESASACMGRVARKSPSVNDQGQGQCPDLTFTGNCQLNSSWKTSRKVCALWQTLPLFIFL